MLGCPVFSSMWQAAASVWRCVHTLYRQEYKASFLEHVELCVVAFSLGTGAVLPRVRVLPRGRAGSRWPRAIVETDERPRSTWAEGRAPT